MRILHVTCSMNPALGGLSACIRSLAPALAELGHPSEIVSLDRPNEPFLASIDARVHPLGPTRGDYAYARRLRPWLKAEAQRFDAVIVHGLWQYHGLATYLTRAPGGSPRIFVFPHGMLDPWFKRKYPLKHIKKWLYWWLAERRVLRAAAEVLFTCEEERRLARESFAGSTYRERVVSLGIASPPANAKSQREAFFQRNPEVRGRPYWLYLGRIHPKKGVDLLIDAFASLSDRTAVAPCLVIAGPCADKDYLTALQRRAASLCPAGSVFWPGMLTGDGKWGALNGAEAFVLPSHQENFGIAVVEALACGTPVLISDQVNVWREIVGDGAGLAEPDTAPGAARLLSRWLAMDPQARVAMAAAARTCFEKRYEIGASARHLLSVLAEDTRPAVHP